MNLTKSFAHFSSVVILVCIVTLLGLNIQYFVHATVQPGKNNLMPTLVNDPTLKIELILNGLKLPTSMTFLAPNDILVLEKNNGTVKRIVNGAILPVPLLNVNVATTGGRGMLGINVAPAEKGNSTYIFLYFIELSGKKDQDAETGGKARLYRYELIDDKLTNPKLLLDVSGQRGVGNKSDEFHNGGKILIGPEKSIYLVVGELSDRYSSTLNEAGDDFPTGEGGILRVTYNGKAINGGNILGDKDPLNKYFAYGIRNSFGLDFDPMTGNLWDTENGHDHGDEINLVKPGFNSGYRIVQGIWYIKSIGLPTAEDIAPQKPKGLIDFGGNGTYSTPEFLNSDKLGKRYENDMFVGDTRGNIYHFELNQNRTGLSLDGSIANKVVNTNAENKDIKFGLGFDTISDMQVGPDGYLYILDHHYGAIFKIIPTQSAVPFRSIINLLDEEHMWRPKNDATISQSNGSLSIDVNSNNTSKIFNHASLQTQINWTKSKPLLLNIDYESKSFKGNATFLAEIREKSTTDTISEDKKILWSGYLRNTSGVPTNETFILSNEITNKPVEFRLYVITEGSGQHALTIKNANIVHQ